MPTWLLKTRQLTLRERMDDPHCDPRKLAATYRHFDLVNRLVAGWRRVYLHWLRPELRRGARSLLDVGCGGGDVLRHISRWAERDGFALECCGIDPDGRAVAQAQAGAQGSRLRFRQAHSSELVAAGERFDLVISNHLLHHLSPEAFGKLCRDSERLARRLALHNDLRRSDLAYLAFALGWPFFLGSFITADGLRSIRRSYTAPELQASAPPGWRAETLFPYRNLLIYRP